MYLESLLLSNVKKDILNKVDSEEIINSLGTRSPYWYLIKCYFKIN